MRYSDTTGATKARLEKAEVRRKIRSGELTLSEVLVDIPKCLQNVPTLFVIDMVPYVGQSRLAQLNYEASKHGINLALPLGALTARAREFLTKWDRERQRKNGTSN